MMLDHDVAACSPSSVYRVLKGAGLLDRHTPKPSSKGNIKGGGYAATTSPVTSPVFYQMQLWQA
ncbi:MAG TPA: hypothetical protein VMF69_00900 [Gemmataceae bacterium]|nr:hypothetical protein [Gemmataceae bacterium]